LETPQKTFHNSLTGGALTVTVQTEDGLEVNQPTDALSWTLIDGEPGDLTMTNAHDPFRDKEFRLTEFFDSRVILYKGIDISRAFVVRHIATARDGVHYGTDRKRDVQRSEVLDRLKAGMLFGKDVVFYVYLSIAQDFARSPDVDRFRDAATKFVANRSG